MINRNRRAWTMTETIIATLVMALCMSASIKAFLLYRGKMAEKLPQRLVLQMEARRALLNLYRILQDGLEVVSPTPGKTQSSLIFKDTQNKLCMVYLEEDPVATDREKRRMYRAMLLSKDPGGATKDHVRTLMENVIKLNFTAYSYGSVYLSAQLHGGGKDFCLVNFVRLQNSSTEALP